MRAPQERVRNLYPIDVRQSLRSCEPKSLLKPDSCFGEYYIVNITKVASFKLSSRLLVDMGTLKFAYLILGSTGNLVCTRKEE